MYVNAECTNCGRLRVELIDGQLICEKCKWNQHTKEYENDVEEVDENDYGFYA